MFNHWETEARHAFGVAAAWRIDADTYARRGDLESAEWCREVARSWERAGDIYRGNAKSEERTGSRLETA